MRRSEKYCFVGRAKQFLSAKIAYLMHGTIPLFIGVRYNFRKITIMFLSLYICTSEQAKGNVVFSSCILTDKVMSALICFGQLLHHVHALIIQSSQLSLYNCDGCTLSLDEGVIQYLSSYT